MFHEQKDNLNMPQVDPLRITSDAAFMAEFMKSQTRDVIDHYLELMGEDFERRLMNFDPMQSPRADDYHKGILAGLRMAQGIPENVLLWAKQIAGEEKKPAGLGQLTLA